MFTVDSDEDVTEEAAAAEDEATTTTAPEVEETPEYCGQVLYCTVLYCTALYCAVLRPGGLQPHAGGGGVSSGQEPLTLHLR